MNIFMIETRRYQNWLMMLYHQIAMTASTIGKLIADGTHDGNDNFRHSVDKGILHYIKVRKNNRARFMSMYFVIEINHLMARSAAFNNLIVLQ